LADPARTTGPSRPWLEPAGGPDITPDPHPARTVRVVLRGGTYYLDEALTFGPEDSGLQGAPVVYAAAAGEKVVSAAAAGSQAFTRGSSTARQLGSRTFRRAERTMAFPAAVLFNGVARPANAAAEARGIPHPIFAGRIPAIFSGVRRSSSSTPRATSCPLGAICGTWKWWGSRGGWTTGCRSRASTAGPARSTFDRPSLFALHSGNKPEPYWVENSSRRWRLPASGISIGRKDGFIICHAREKDVGHPRKSFAAATGRKLVARSRGARARRRTTSAFEGLTFSHTEWQPPADYASSLQAGIEVPGGAAV